MVSLIYMSPASLVMHKVDENIAPCPRMVTQKATHKHTFENFNKEQAAHNF